MDYNDPILLHKTLLRDKSSKKPHSTMALPD